MNTRIILVNVTRPSDESPQVNFIFLRMTRFEVFFSYLAILSICAGPPSSIISVSGHPGQQQEQFKIDSVIGSKSVQKSRNKSKIKADPLLGIHKSLVELSRMNENHLKYNVDVRRQRSMGYHINQQHQNWNHQQQLMSLQAQPQYYYGKG